MGQTKGAKDKKTRKKRPGRLITTVASPFNSATGGSSVSAVAPAGDSKSWRSRWNEWHHITVVAYGFMALSLVLSLCTLDDAITAGNGKFYSSSRFCVCRLYNNQLGGEMMKTTNGWDV
jgi:hypothetical protein